MSSKPLLSAKGIQRLVMWRTASAQLTDEGRAGTEQASAARQSALLGSGSPLARTARQLRLDLSGLLAQPARERRGGAARTPPPPPEGPWARFTPGAPPTAPGHA